MWNRNIIQVLVTVPRFVSAELPLRPRNRLRCITQEGGHNARGGACVRQAIVGLFLILETKP